MIAMKISNFITDLFLNIMIDKDKIIPQTQ